jgi:hypothetical protein
VFAHANELPCISALLNALKIALWANEDGVEPTDLTLPPFPNFGHEGKIAEQKNVSPTSV